jgi:predicted phosphoribosyltransferase
LIVEHLPSTGTVSTRHTPGFENRETAGRQLSEALREAGVDADVVLAIPRGGLPLGRAVADALDAPLDVVVCLVTPRRFRAVGQFYDQFDQVSDE